MKIHVRCRGCGATWDIVDEPRIAMTLACSQCGARAEPRACEDFASAIEDALTQLGWLARSFEVDAHLSSEQIPAPFRPDWEHDDDA